MPSLRIGLGLVTAELPRSSARSFADEYADTLRVAERAEALGFDSIWTSEHHGVSDGYLPSQLILLAAVAAVTERIQLGTGIVVAPLYDPLRLAEDAAVLDQVSRGRLNLGLGLGWRPEEYRMFGVPFAARVARLADTVHVLRRAFTGERFSYSGPGHTYEDVLVTPRPYRRGGPPILIGAFAPGGVRRAGLLGDGFIRSRRGDRRALEDDVRTARAGVAEAGRSDDDFTFVLLHNVGLTGPESPMSTDRVRAGLAYQLGVYAALHDDDDTPGRGFQARPIEPATVDAAAIWGTPGEVAAELVDQVAAVGPDRPCELVLRLGYPGMDGDDSLRLLEVFAAEVVPRVRAAVAELPAAVGETR